MASSFFIHSCFSIALAIHLVIINPIYDASSQNNNHCFAYISHYFFSVDCNNVYHFFLGPTAPQPHSKKIMMDGRWSQRNAIIDLSPIYQFRPMQACDSKIGLLQEHFTEFDTNGKVKGD